MVKLRKSHKKLRMALCCVLGVIIAFAGVAAIILFSGSVGTNDVPDILENTKMAVPTGTTPDMASSDDSLSGNTLYYLAYVLDQQEYYHVEATNVSGASIGKATTKTEKDYVNGVMIASDITYGMSSSASQTCYITNTDGSITAYRRSGSDSSSSATVSTISWNDTYSDTYYYSRSDYLYIYGEFSTEMTVYLINEDTLQSYGSIVNNGDGTYTQSFSFKSSAAYYYQYAQKTNGGLDDYPEFESINMTVTFDGNWQVLEIYVVEDTVTPIYGLTIGTSAETTTTFTYGESSVDDENYSFYESYFESAIPNATAGGSAASSETDSAAYKALMGVFSDLLSSKGDQFEFTLDLNGTKYYGIIYLSVDMSNISVDTIKAKVLISSDKTYGSQDLYIEFVNSDINVYYSTEFAMTADIDEFTDVISEFSGWIENSVFTDSSSDSSDSSSDNGLDLNDLLAGITVETDDDGNIITDDKGNFVIIIDIELLGIGIYAEINANLTQTDGKDVYTFIDATLGSISYGDDEIAVGLTLLPSDEDEISRSLDSSQTALDLSQAAESIYALLGGDSIQADLTIDGESLVTIVNSVTGSEYADYLALVKDYDITLSALVDADGFATTAKLTITDGSSSVIIDIDVYYLYDGTSEYGTAYLTVNKFMGEDCSVKAYCDIDDLVTGITKIITLVQAETSVSLASEEGEEQANTLVTIINSLLGADFDKLIVKHEASGKLLAVSLDGDYLVSLILPEVENAGIGNIALNYSYSTNSENKAQAGTLTLDLTGISATVKAGSDKVTAPDASEYLDLNSVADSVYELLASDYLQLDVYVSGAGLVSLVNSLTGSEYADYLALIEKYDIELSATVSLDGEVQLNLLIKDDAVTIIDLDVYYLYDGSSTYGVAYLTVNKFVGVDCSVKVYCNIADLVTSITDIIAVVENDTGVSLASEEAGESETLTTAQLIGSILGLDYSQIINEIKVNSTDGISASLNIDSILQLLGVDITLGDIQLDYTFTTDGEGNAKAGTLSLGITGISAALKASGNTIAEPSGTFFSLNSLAAGITNVITVAQDIAANGATFAISGEIAVNDATISLDGTGEVVLDENTGSVTSVAADVTLAITNGIYGSESNKVNMQVVYLAENYNASAEDAFLYVVIDGQGIAVTYSQYASFTQDIGTIYSVISALTTDSGSSSGGSTTGTTVSDDSLLIILQYITGILSDEDVLANLNSLSYVLNNVAITSGEDGSISITYTYGEDGEGNALTFNVAKVTTADGKLTLATDIADMYAEITAYDGTASLAATLTKGFEDCNMSNNLDSMVYMLYGYIFDCLDGINLSSVFGASAAGLEFVLDGDASGITDLEGVYVNATANVSAVDGKNIYSVSADIDISGFTVNVSMVYYSDYIYIDINEIGGTEISDLAVKASADDIYSVIESVVNLIMDENVLSLAGSLANGGTAATVSEELGGTEEEISGQTQSTLSKVLELLTGILKGSVIVVDVNGEQLAAVDLNAILSPFGITQDVGSLNIELCTDSGSNVTGINAYVANTVADAENKWLTLYLGAATAKYSKVDYDTTYAGTQSGTFFAGAYMDLGFASQMVKDIATFAKSGLSDSGVEYTFTGSISVPISYSIISATVNITDIELTVGYSDADGLYVNMFGKVNSSSYLGFTVSAENYIGVSYSTNTGLITLARGLNSDGSASDSTIYWAMTPEWFIDNMMSSDNSPLRFLLGTSDTAWSLIAGLVDLPLSSGLADTEEYYLYNTASSGSTIDIFGSDSYIASFVAMLSGKNIGSYGDYEGLVSQLALSGYSDGYYAFSLGSALLGDTISPVYLALTRSSTYGLSDILAYLAIDSYLTVSVNLGYAGSNYSTVTCNYYDMAASSVSTEIDTVNGGGTTTANDYDYYKFGSVYISGGSCTYYDSYCLTDDYVTVYVYDIDGDGNYFWTGEKITLRYGSVVYLYTLDSYGIITDSNGNAVVYVTESDLADLKAGSKEESSLATEVTLDSSVISYDNDGNAYVNIYEYETSSTVYTVNIYNVSGDKLYSYYVFGDQDVTRLYGDYTLVGGLYSDSSCTTEVDTTNDVQTLAEGSTTLDLYGSFVQNTVTKNGVTYTYVNSSSYSYAGSQYTLTGTLETSGYYEITAFDFSYSGEWLILENEINGYPVIAIVNEAFNPGYNSGDDTRDSLTNVIVPENIIYIGTRAFAYHESITTIVFLADTIYLDNGSGNGREYYPFTSDSDLTVYHNNYYGMGEGSSPATSDIPFATADKSTGTYVKAHTSTWTYLSGIKVTSPDSLTYEADDIQSDITELLSSYGYNEALYKAHGVYFYTTSVGFASAVQTALLEKINAYTAETYGYINGYTVEVTVSGYVLAVKVTATENNYYKVTVTNYLYGASDYEVWNVTATAYEAISDGVNVTYSDGDNSVVVNYSGTMEVYGNTLYAAGNITISANNSGFALEDTSSYNNSAATLYWKQVTIEYPVTIYTDVAFTLGGISVAAGSTTTELGASDATLDSLQVTAPENYYFLGWAYEAEDILTFTSNITTSDSITYYAIWGYNANVTLTDYSGTSGSTSLPTPTVSSGTFYNWYTDGAFTSQTVTSLQSGNYTYYARMSFTLTLEFYGSAYALYQPSDLNDTTKQEVGDTNTSKYAYYTIYEGDAVAIEITDSNTYVRVYINNTDTYDFYAMKRSYSWFTWSETTTYRTFNDSSSHAVYLNGSDTAITTGETSVYSGTVSSDYSVKFCI